MASARVRKLSRDLHRKRVHARVRMKVEGTEERPRLAVYRSLGHIYVQVIDDRLGVPVSAGRRGVELIGLDVRQHAGEEQPTVPM